MNFSAKKMLTVLTFSTLAVLGHWNIWSQGIYALGFNTTLFWLFLGLLLWDNNPQLGLKKDWNWITPLFLMTLSFSLFENPWLKLISCLVLPTSSGIFYAYSQLINASNHFWGFSLLQSIIKRSFTPFQHIFGVFIFIQKSAADSFSQQKNHHINKRIFTGVLLLLPMAAIVLALLSSADKNFSDLVDKFFLQFFGSLDLTAVAKIICIFGLSIFLFATLHALKDPYEITEHKFKIPIDDIVIGIVMGGILIIYLLFLWLQIDYLMLDTLPQNFKATERIVKSGFWQLFFLSILNTALFLIVYKKTGTIAQHILRIFIAASGLLLLSAAWRMSMYVYWYGFSYEKFFASYTTLFALIVFIYLLLASFSKKRKDVFRIMTFAALWTYAIATVMPVEKFIFNSNVDLSQLSSSRINLYELKNLSIDIIIPLEKYFDLEHFPDNKLAARQLIGWKNWVKQKKLVHCNRPWHERNISLIMVCN